MAELTITENNYDELVQQASVPVLLDFWAAWCGPCRMLAPVVAEIAEEYDGRVAVGKVNVDEEPGLAEQFRVESIPTVVILKAGEAVAESVGYKPKEALCALLDQVL